MIERRPVLAPAAVLFGIMFSHALLETARDALFLSRLGPHRLAWAYLAIAGTATLAVTVVRRWARVRDPRRMLLWFLTFAALGTWLLAATIVAHPTVVFLLYVWTGFVATLVVPALWTVVDRTMQITEAKRAFGAIGAGGVLGAMTGSALASFLGRVIPAHQLVTVGAAAFTAALALAAWLAPRASTDQLEPVRRKREALSHASARYVRLLIVVGLVSTVTLTLGDIMFKRVVSERFAASDLAVMFGAIYTLLNVLSLVIQLVVTPRLLAHGGVGTALLVLPALLLVTASGIAMTGALAAILALKAADGSLRHSLHRAGSEILFLPLPADSRDGWKPIADAVSQRGGQALAALLLLGLGSFGLASHVFAAIVAVLAGIWVLVLFAIRSAYVAQFRAMLRAGEVEHDARVPDLDSDALALLIESLASPDEVEAMAALDLLATRASRVPALVLYHPREAVVRRALALLEGQLRPDVARVLGHLLEHSDPRIRAAALAAASRTRSNLERLRAATHDPDPHVRAVALVCMLDTRDPSPEISAGIAALVAGSTEDRVALAHAISLVPHPHLRPVLYDLLATPEPAVKREVLHVFTRVPALADLDRMLDLLEDPHVRGDVRRVFIAAGRRGLIHLVAALDNPRIRIDVRRHLPRTISRFGTPQAIGALVARLPREPDGTTEFKILRALGRMRANNPTLPIATDVLEAYVRRSLGDAARYAVLLDRLDAEPTPLSAGGALIRELVDEKRRWAIEHTFRALGVVHPEQDLRSVHDAITGDSEARRGAAREILEALLPAEERTHLLAVLDHLTPEQRRERLGELAPGPFASYESLLSALLADPSESLKCVVAHEIAERNLTTLRPDLTRLRPRVGRPLVIYAFDQALERLHA